MLLTRAEPPNLPPPPVHFRISAIGAEPNRLICRSLFAIAFQVLCDEVQSAGLPPGQSR